jgi:uncharacterized membrane protein
MLNREELKNSAKAQLAGKWGGGILVVFIMGMISGAGSSAMLGLLIEGPIMFGKIKYFFDLMKSPTQPEINVAFDGFKFFFKALVMYLWMTLWTLLWTMLFFIPGIVKGIAYSQSMYIIVENPEISYADAMKMSIRMTQGYKGEIFVMQLSFIGWALLCVLTCGIGFLWLEPYMQTAFCNMYYKLKGNSIQNGTCLQSEFDVGPAPQQY